MKNNKTMCLRIIFIGLCVILLSYCLPKTFNQNAIKNYIYKNVIEPWFYITSNQCFPIIKGMDKKIQSTSDLFFQISPILAASAPQTFSWEQEAYEWIPIEKEETSKEQSYVEIETEVKEQVSEQNSYQLPKQAVHIYTPEELEKTSVLKTLYVLSSAGETLVQKFDGNKWMRMNLSIKQDSTKKQILIYHTHSMEGYIDSVEGDIETGIVGVGTYLTELLTQLGYGVIHLTDQFDVVDGRVHRTNAYERARGRLEEILNEHPEIEVVIDLHRDGVDDEIKLICDINGVQTAKIMFFNGNYMEEFGAADTLFDENMAMSLQMKCLAMAYYPELTRPNYIRDDHYNMNLRGKSMLIEVGAQTNTLQEAKNAMEPFALLLYELLNE